MPKITSDNLLKNQLCFAIYNDNRMFNSFYKKVLRAYSLTYPQYLVLLSLWEKSPRSFHDLSTQLGLPSNTLTPLLRRLEEHGWIYRKKNPKDLRCLEIYLSRKGKGKRSSILNTIRNCISGKNGISVNEYKKLLISNQKLLKKLKSLVNTV